MGGISHIMKPLSLTVGCTVIITRYCMMLCGGMQPLSWVLVGSVIHSEQSKICDIDPCADLSIWSLHALPMLL